MTTLEKLNAMLEPSDRIDTTIGRKSFDGEDYLKNIPHIKCADGFKFSVQASWSHYCTPRDSRGPWTEVEVGFPTERIEDLMPYVEDPNNPTGTVYGYVPIAIVAKVIDDHGGFSK